MVQEEEGAIFSGTGHSRRWLISSLVKHLSKPFHHAGLHILWSCLLTLLLVNLKLYCLPRLSGLGSYFHETLPRLIFGHLLIIFSLRLLFVSVNHLAQELFVQSVFKPFVPLEEQNTFFQSLFVKLLMIKSTDHIHVRRVKLDGLGGLKELWNLTS